MTAADTLAAMQAAMETELRTIRARYEDAMRPLRARAVAELTQTRPTQETR